MAAFTFSLDGTFSLDDARHLMQQLDAIPSNVSSYDYDAQKRRRFKGKITISCEEIAPLPAPEPDPTTE